MTVIRLDSCEPVCNHCRHYEFNGDENGAYVNAGRCEHPDHPCASEPDQSCPDFSCRTCPKAPKD